MVAHLVSRVDGSMPMVYCDDELLFPDHVQYRVDAKERFGDRLRIVQGIRLASWLVPTLADRYCTVAEATGRDGNHRMDMKAECIAGRIGVAAGL